MQPDLEIRCEEAEVFFRRLRSESVDACITDPYGVDSYALAAKHLRRVLKAGGAFAAIVPIAALPRILASVEEHLSYSWTVAMVQYEGTPSSWKPVVWWHKGKHGMVFPDLFTSHRSANRPHKWQQTEHWARTCLKQVPACGMVIDPFVGTGTVAVECRRMGYSFRGCDREPEMIEMAKCRLGWT